MPIGFPSFFDIGDNENFRALLKVYGNFSGGRALCEVRRNFGESDMLAGVHLRHGKARYRIINKFRVLSGRSPYPLARLDQDSNFGTQLQAKITKWRKNISRRSRR